MKGYTYQGDKLNVEANVLTSAVVAGELVSINGLYGVTLNDGAANAVNTVQIEGVVELAKATGAGTGGAQGAKANDNGSQLITAGAGSLVGTFWATAADGDATALVKLQGNQVA